MAAEEEDLLDMASVHFFLLGQFRPPHRSTPVYHTRNSLNFPPASAWYKIKLMPRGSVVGERWRDMSLIQYSGLDSATFELLLASFVPRWVAAWPPSTRGRPRLCDELDALAIALASIRGGGCQDMHQALFSPRAP